MNNPNFLPNPGVTVSHAGGAIHTRDEIEADLVARTDEFRNFSKREGQLVDIIKRCEDAVLEANRALTEARNELYAVHQRVDQARREMQTAFQRHAAMQPIPPAPTADDYMANPAQAYARPGGAFDQEKARAGLIETLSPAQVNAAQTAETLRLLAITREQIARRTGPVQVAVVENKPAAPEGESK